MKKKNLIITSILTSIMLLIALSAFLFIKSNSSDMQESTLLEEEQYSEVQYLNNFSTKLLSNSESNDPLLGFQISTSGEKESIRILAQVNLNNVVSAVWCRQLFDSDSNPVSKGDFGTRQELAIETAYARVQKNGNYEKPSSGYTHFFAYTLKNVPTANNYYLNIYLAINGEDSSTSTLSVKIDGTTATCSSIKNTFVLDNSNGSTSYRFTRDGEDLVDIQGNSFVAPTRNACTFEGYANNSHDKLINSAGEITSSFAQPYVDLVGIWKSNYQILGSSYGWVYNSNDTLKSDLLYSNESHALFSNVSLTKGDTFKLFDGESWKGHNSLYSTDLVVNDAEDNIVALFTGVYNISLVEDSSVWKIKIDKVSLANLTIELDVSSWEPTNARYAINLGGDNWFDMTDAGNNIWTVTLNEENILAAYNLIIFCRMKGASTENNWKKETNLWNQTVNLQLRGNRRFLVNNWHDANDYDKSNGYWVS